MFYSIKFLALKRCKYVSIVSLHSQVSLLSNKLTFLSVCLCRLCIFTPMNTRAIDDTYLFLINIVIRLTRNLKTTRKFPLSIYSKILSIHIFFGSFNLFQNIEYPFFSVLSIYSKMLSIYIFFVFILFQNIEYPSFLQFLQFIH